VPATAWRKLARLVNLLFQEGASRPPGASLLAW